MFDVGFFELMLIGIVALLVVGPEKLPKVARTAGLWLGKGRKFITSVKADIEKELKAEELQKMLDEREKLNPLHDVVEETQSVFEDIKSGTQSAIDSGKEAMSSKEDMASLPLSIAD